MNTKSLEFSQKNIHQLFFMRLVLCKWIYPYITQKKNISVWFDVNLNLVLCI